MWIIESATQAKRHPRNVILQQQLHIGRGLLRIFFQGESGCPRCSKGELNAREFGKIFRCKEYFVGYKFPKFPSIITPPSPLSTCGTLSHPEKLLTVIHVPYFFAPCKMITWRCGLPESPPLKIHMYTTQWMEAKK